MHEMGTNGQDAFLGDTSTCAPESADQLSGSKKKPSKGEEEEKNRSKPLEVSRKYMHQKLIFVMNSDPSDGTCVTQLFSYHPGNVVVESCIVTVGETPDFIHQVKVRTQRQFKWG